MQRDVPGFSGADFGDKPSVPDDVLEDVGRFFDMMADYQDDAGQSLPYQGALLADLEPKLQSAAKEWSEAETADKHYQTLLADVRRTGEMFDNELKPLRRTLTVVAGRNDKDYQKLRAQKAQIVDDDDDAHSPAPPLQLSDATDDAGPPVN